MCPKKNMDHLVGWWVVGGLTLVIYTKVTKALGSCRLPFVLQGWIWELVFFFAHKRKRFDLWFQVVPLVVGWFIIVICKSAAEVFFFLILEVLQVQRPPLIGKRMAGVWKKSPDEKETQCKNQHLHHSWGFRTSFSGKNGGPRLEKKWRHLLPQDVTRWKQLPSVFNGWTGHFWQNIGGHRERDFGGQGQWLARKNRPSGIRKTVQTVQMDVWVVEAFMEFIYIHMGVSENSGAPKSSILIGFSVINHPFWGTPIFGNTHMDSYGFIAHSSIWEEKESREKALVFFCRTTDWYPCPCKGVKIVFAENEKIWKTIPISTITSKANDSFHWDASPGRRNILRWLGRMVQMIF